MLEKMGVKRLAYDYRAEHIPTFDAEMEALKRHQVQLLAWWFPTELNAEAKNILEVLRRHGIRAQLWVTGGGTATKTPEEQRAKVAAEVRRLRPIALAAAEIGCSVALYNHGGWFGEPDNQIAIIQALGLKNVGIVYNQHHGHDHLASFPQLLERMKPYLLALNLNGMTAEGDRKGRKILPLGQGDLDLSLLKTIESSGWSGPIGILNHTDEDAEARLLDNLDGLEWLVPQLHGKPAGPKPTPRSWREPQPTR
jgi:sugar phosphate isomerase/epimerase